MRSWVLRNSATVRRPSSTSASERGSIEALAGKRLLPFILDDPFSGFDPARQQAACQVLRALGKKTQVVLFTANPALRMAGEPAAELK